jgi:hypothetical protein
MLLCQLRGALTVGVVFSGAVAASSVGWSRTRELVAPTVQTLSPALASAPPTLLTVAVGSKHAFEVRPKSFTYDGTGHVTVGPLRPGGPQGPGPKQGYWHWKRWEHERADGTGTIWVDDFSCGPSCIVGVPRAHRGSVTASRVRHGHFTRLKIRYRLSGIPVVDFYGLTHDGASWSWYVISLTGN